MEGRIQVYEYWDQCLGHDGSSSVHPSVVDPGMLSELVQGSKQLMFSEHMNPLVNPYVARASLLAVSPFLLSMYG